MSQRRKKRVLSFFPLALVALVQIQLCIGREEREGKVAAALCLKVAFAKQVSPVFFAVFAKVEIGGFVKKNLYSTATLAVFS